MNTTACRSRAPIEGNIYQRPFGGMTTEFGEGTAQRTCAAADRTGHAMLHTLYQQSLKHKAEFFVEYFAIDLIMDDDGVCRGVLAWDLAEGKLHCVPGPGNTGHRWLRPHVLLLHLGAYLHRATARAWCCAPDCRCRTWNSSSSIPPAFTARVA